jgi:hypothetical protein
MWTPGVSRHLPPLPLTGATLKKDLGPTGGSLALNDHSSTKGNLQLSIRTRESTSDAENTYALTVIRRNATESVYEKTTVPPPVAPSQAAPDTAVAPVDTGSANASATDAAPEMAQADGAQRVAPLLRRNPQSGLLEIGNFNSVQLTGTGEDCITTGQSLLTDLGLSGDSVVSVAESDQISIARICASNGSIILSCRNDVTTISPRRPRPDDKCNRLS